METVRAAGYSLGVSSNRSANRRFPERLGARFRGAKLMGRGGMGSVFRAVDRVLRRQVAVKIIDPENIDELAAARFVREGQILASLSHPGVVRVFDAEYGHGVAYLVMEHLEGQTLLERLQSGPCNHDEVLRILRSSLSTLTYLHGRGILHRDLKPSNIFLRREGEPVLIDFGLARSMDDCRFTRPGEVIGTVPYLAPELLTEPTQTAHSDLYGLALTAFEASTLIDIHSGLPLPRTNTSASSIFNSLSSGVYLDVAHARLGGRCRIGDVILKGLARVEDRYGSAEAMLADLPSGATGEPTDREDLRDETKGTSVSALEGTHQLTTHPAGPTSSPERPHARSTGRTRAFLLLLMVGGSLCVAVVALTWLIASREPAPSSPSPRSTPASPEDTSVSIWDDPGHVLAWVDQTCKQRLQVLENSRDPAREESLAYWKAISGHFRERLGSLRGSVIPVEDSGSVHFPPSLSPIPEEMLTESAGNPRDHGGVYHESETSLDEGGAETLQWSFDGVSLEGVIEARLVIHAKAVQRIRTAIVSFEDGTEIMVLALPGEKLAVHTIPPGVLEPGINTVKVTLPSSQAATKLPWHIRKVWLRLRMK